MAYGSTDIKKRIGRIGGTDAVIEAIKAGSSDSELQVRCCVALRNLTCDVRVSQWIAGRSLGIEAIVHALASFADEESLQYHGCVALCNVCADEPDKRQRAADSGALEVALRLLRNNVSHTDIVQYGGLFLRNMSIGDSGRQLRIGSEAGIDVVLQYLSGHLASPGIMECSCAALRFLFFELQNLHLFGQHGGMEILVRVLWEGGKDPEVAESALYAVGNSVYDVPESNGMFSRHGRIAALVGVMFLHLDRAGGRSGARVSCSPESVEC
jgi:hypothetical protein